MRIMQRMMNDVMPRYEYVRTGRAQGLEVKYNDKEFEIKLDVSDYSPEELTVKVTDDTLTISGKHSEKSDGDSLVSRQFTRQFAIPENVESECIESLLTSDGQLVIKGVVTGKENVQERVVNIAREEPAKEEKK